MNNKLTSTVVAYGRLAAPPPANIFGTAFADLSPPLSPDKDQKHGKSHIP